MTKQEAEKLNGLAGSVQNLAEIVNTLIDTMVNVTEEIRLSKNENITLCNRLNEIELDIDGSSGSTISFWAKRNATNVIHVVLGNTATSTYSELMFLTDGTMHFETDTNGDQMTITLAVNDTNWHHYAFVGSGASISAYQDNIALSINTPSIQDNLTFNCIGGHGTGGTTNEFNGNLDEVAVWDTALTQSAITELYNNGNTKDIRLGNFKHLFDSNCKGYWRMGDGDTYPTITDNSSNSKNGTMTNMVAGDIEEDTP